MQYTSRVVRKHVTPDWITSASDCFIRLSCTLFLEKTCFLISNSRFLRWCNRCRALQLFYARSFTDREERGEERGEKIINKQNKKFRNCACLVASSWSSRVSLSKPGRQLKGLLHHHRQLLCCCSSRAHKHLSHSYNAERTATCKAGIEEQEFVFYLPAATLCISQHYEIMGANSIKRSWR